MRFVQVMSQFHIMKLTYLLCFIAIWLQTSLHLRQLFHNSQIFAHHNPVSLSKPISSNKGIHTEKVRNFPQILLRNSYLYHRFAYPKGVHSYRNFLQPMRTPSSLPPAHAYSEFQYYLLFPGLVQIKIELFHNTERDLNRCTFSYPNRVFVFMASVNYISRCHGSILNCITCHDLYRGH